MIGRMRYELYYWPSIQGRGEFVRLALEDAGAEYVDVARRKGGVGKMMRLMESATLARPPWAPPFLRAGKLVIGQAALILHYLGPRLGLAPRDEAGRMWAHQLQLTIADFATEGHNIHHPVAVALYYEQQKKEAKRAAPYFTKERIPKYLDHFEAVLERNDGRHLRGPLHVPDDGLAALRLSPRDETACIALSAVGAAARSSRGAPPARGIPRLAAAAALQRGRPLPALSGARPLGPVRRALRVLQPK